MQVAEVSRVARDDAGELIGYQRPEVKKHVQNIQQYLDGNKGRSLFPNSLILALSSSATFSKIRGPQIGDGLTEAGTVEIPIPSSGRRKPAWIVDGQQRALALSRCKNRDLPVPVSAFIADDVDTQREQFLRVNSSKPLPRGLVTELLPQVDTVLPPNLAARRVPAALCEVLNRDPESPFSGLIKRASSPQSKRSVVADTVVIQMLQESFGSPSGCLFPIETSRPARRTSTACASCSTSIGAQCATPSRRRGGRILKKAASCTEPGCVRWGS
jgi:DGQHR domain-containing protein